MLDSLNTSGMHCKNSRHEEAVQSLHASGEDGIIYVYFNIKRRLGIGVGVWLRMGQSVEFGTRVAITP